MSEITYEELVVEAFIEPIRSVLIVDDDYPTFHEVLLDPKEREDKHGHKDWNKSSENRAKVRAVIDEFRRPDAPYLLDIHDGTSPSEETDEEQVGTLQQTDLLILDYQLDKSKEGDGTAAIRIARETLTNEHFNLVLVHTQEDLERVFNEFLIGFMSPCFSADHAIQPDDELQDFLNNNEDSLLAAISDQQYISARKEMKNSTLSEVIRRIHKGEAPWGQLKSTLTDAKLHPRNWPRAVQYAMEVFEENNSSRFSSEDVGVIHWKEEPKKFIRTSRGFVTFKSKKENQELLLAIRDALFAWDPRPSRLMLTKLRAEMNARGIEVQDDALGETDVAAMWYLRLLQADDRNLDAIVDQTVRNHSEQLLDQLLPSVSAFAKRIRDVDVKSNPIETVKSRFGLNLSDEAVLAGAKMGHNAFVGSKPANSIHLELGHILKIGEDFWACLTPACDMVPKVHRGKPYDRIDGVKRFTALKLVPRKQDEALCYATRGGQVFANIESDDGKVERRAFSAAVELGASPAWMTMYVQNDGYLPRSGDADWSVSYVSASQSAEGPTFPTVVQSKAKVCGMLRYEYALEVQSRFITSQSRIGLDFENADEPQSSVPATKEEKE